LRETLRLLSILIIAPVLVACAARSGALTVSSLKQAEKYLESSDPSRRLAAVQYLENDPPPNTVMLLGERLADEDKLVRLQAVIALRRTSSPLAVAPLRKPLEDPDPDIRFAAASALFELGDYSGEEKLLVDGLGSEREDFRLQALMFLGRMRSRAAFDRFIELLDDSSPRIRSTAAYILGLMNDLSAVEPLLEAMNDEVDFVRKDAWEALETLTAQEMEFHYEGDADLRDLELKAWRQWWEADRHLPGLAK